MPVVRLCEVDDLALRDAIAVDAAQVGKHDVTPQRREAVDELAGEGHVHAGRLRERHRRRAFGIVRERQPDRLDAVAVEQRARIGRQQDPGRAIVVARDGEIRGRDLPQRGLAREQLHAGFLGGKARRKARGAS